MTVLVAIGTRPIHEIHRAVRLEQQGKFPKRIKVGERRVVWRSEEVMACLNQKGRKDSDTFTAGMKKRVVKALKFFLSKVGLSE